MSQTIAFNDLGIIKPLLNALEDLGYETPSTIQQKTIPVLLDGCDLVAQAQTGTGKTAAFALPILQKLDLKRAVPQALVLTPTRELAIQVAESFQRYAKHLKNFHVVPIYGGQDYQQQLRALKRGVHVVVGTPGRIMDHLRNQKLSLLTIDTVILDEADEMLKMGFLNDVEWILGQIPHEHQSAFFSATMPDSIKKITKNYLSKPVNVKIEARSIAATGTEQSAMLVNQRNKLEAITRYLEIEPFEAIIIFTRTKNATSELAEKLAARGYLVAALNGDMNQAAREKVIERIKRKSLDIVVATDVAARGLDVDRLSHVINYDAPSDVETYVHRIGRTGRAGRQGKSVLLLTPRERGFLNDIQRITAKKVMVIDPPSVAALRSNRVDNFVRQVLGVMDSDKLDYYRELAEKIAHDSERDMLCVAAALLKIAQKDKPLQMKGGKDVLLEEEQHSYSPPRKKRRASGPPHRQRGKKPAAKGGGRRRP